MHQASPRPALVGERGREVRHFLDDVLDQSGREKTVVVASTSNFIAMVCSDPPEGRARWTLRLIAEQAVKRRLVPRVGRETIRVLLLNHDLKPWREKNVVRGRAD